LVKRFEFIKKGREQELITPGSLIFFGVEKIVKKSAKSRFGNGFCDLPD